MITYPMGTPPLAVGWMNGMVKKVGTAGVPTYESDYAKPAASPPDGSALPPLRVTFALMGQLPDIYRARSITRIGSCAPGQVH